MQKPGPKFEIPESCPKCNAPLKKENIEALRINKVIDCPYCGSAIKIQRKD